LGCAFFEADAGCTTWLKNADLEDLDVGDLLMASGNRMVEQLQTRVDKDSRARQIVEARFAGIQEKAKDFVVRELNDTAAAVIRAIDSEESKIILEFNEAVDASFPPATVLLAGVLSPAILSATFTFHMVQLLLLFLPIFVFTLWAVLEDFGATCDIPTMRAWVWATFALSTMQVLGRGLSMCAISSGQSALKAKTAEITRRLESNAADGETGLSDMQEIFIGSTVLLQEALIVEDSVRRSPWVDIVGVATVLWILAVIWNFVIVIGWTFVPGTMAFHSSAHEAAAGDFCGAWASVFTARLVCLLTPLFFFLNIASVAQWVLQKIIFSRGVSSAVLGVAKDFDYKHGRVPVMQTLVKALILRAESDASKAKLTVALGEALRLSKERADAVEQLEQLKGRINAAKIERRSMKALAKRSGGSMEANLRILEEATSEQTDAWKAKGQQLVEAAEKRAAASQQVARDQLDRIIQYLTDLMDRVQNNPQVKAALEKAKRTAVEAKEAAASGYEHGKEAAAQAMVQAKEAAEYAQAHAHEAAEAGRNLAQGTAEKALTGLEAGKAAASKAAAEAQKKAAEAQKAAKQYTR